MRNDQNEDEKLDPYERYQKYKKSKIQEYTQPACEICGAVISKKEYDENEGFCNECVDTLMN